MSDLIRKERANRSDAIEERLMPSIGTALPSPSEMISLCSHSPSKKAVGEDLQYCNLYRVFPKLFATLYYPLIFKSIASIRPPLDWRGGMLHELYKQKGATTDMSNYRDVSIANHLPKLVTRHIRRALMGDFEDKVLTTQWGSGIHGGETAVAHLYIRNCIDIARRAGHSIALLFLDIHTAFASLVRHLVFNVDDGDEAWLAKLRAFGFEETDIKDIYECAVSPLFSPSVRDKVAFKFAEELHRCTWSTTEGLTGIINTSQGSMAGMTLADLVYASAFSKVIHTLIKSLSNDNLIPVIGDGMKVFPVAFHDDLVIPTRADSALQLVPLNLRVADIMCTVFNMFCLTVNFLPGKTASLVAFSAASN